MQTDADPVPKIKTHLSKKDIFSTIKVRCGIKRHKYTVTPGLYCIGNPDKNSEVLVTANFKLTFDHVRSQLEGLDVWILVLDTKGVNVWCAASKGTFATDELVRQIKRASLEKIVSHHRVIVPQLGATGVSAKKVKKDSGFRVVYGPIRASDIMTFLKNDRKADQKMRMVTFTFSERLILIPVELNMVMKPAFIVLAIILLLSGIGPGIFSFSVALSRGSIAAAALFIGVFTGAVITPALLPYIPFKAFAIKGIITGVVFALATGFMLTTTPFVSSMTSLTSLFLLTIAISSFLAMNFTGATPLTSPSGVEKEMKMFIPVQLLSLATAVGFWIYSAF
ncbi:MAG: hypothetical protein KAI40_06845 [Desulfobacterales bacterium]|nr:hypothetical protein [Desulfobacterales bacterium]